MEAVDLISDIKAELEDIKMAGKKAALIRIHPVYHRTLHRFGGDDYSRQASRDGIATFLGVPVEDDVKQKCFEVFIE